MCFVIMKNFALRRAAQWMVVGYDGMVGSIPLALRKAPFIVGAGFLTSEPGELHDLEPPNGQDQYNNEENIIMTKNRSEGKKMMIQKIREPKLPRGFGRLAFRAPIWLYYAGLGWIFGHRFLLLTHTGRKSGLQRQTVLEVVRYDKAKKTFSVASGWGKKSDWYRNIMVNPLVMVESGKEKFAARAEQLSDEEAGVELVDYSRRHPWAMKELARFMGYKLEYSEDTVRQLAHEIPIVVLLPV